MLAIVNKSCWSWKVDWWVPPDPGSLSGIPISSGIHIVSPVLHVKYISVSCTTCQLMGVVYQGLAARTRGLCPMKA